MTSFKKKSLIISAFILWLGPVFAQINSAFFNQKNFLATNFLQKKSDLKNFASPLTTDEITALFDALASTDANADSAALALIATIADNQPNLLWAYFNIINALTTQDPDHQGTSPLEAATAAVKLALATKTLPSSYGSYTLLHFAAFFDIVAAAIDDSIDAGARAATVASTLLRDLTQTQILTALTAKDPWNSTPLHYAAFSQDSAAALMTALCQGITQDRTKTKAISAKNIWGYTPIHHAAINPNNTIIDPLFLVVTPAQKLAAISALDQWNTTPLHYAALFSNHAIIDPLFFIGITTTQLIKAIGAKNLWNSTTMHYAALAADASIVDPLFTYMTVAQKISFTTAKNKWNFSPLDLSKLATMQDSSGKWLRSDSTNFFIGSIIPTPFFEYATTVIPRILGQVV